MVKKMLAGLVFGILILGLVDIAMADWGNVTLYNMDSYDFETGNFGILGGGDLYFLSELSGQHGFWANNLYQRGVVDVGDISNPLNEIAAPESGYSRFGVLPILGHTYVSLVHGDTPFSTISLEDNLIFFRVTNLTNESVSLDYYYGPGAISPDIKANGSDGPVTIAPGDTLSVTIALYTGSRLGDNADWWVLVQLPSGGWYHWMPSSGWRSGRAVTHQGALFDVSSYRVLNTSSLTTPGLYKFYFAVDMNMNGSIDMDQIYYDLVRVNVTP